MSDRLKTAWNWFVEGLVEALLRALDRIGHVSPLRLELGDGEAVVVDSKGVRLGRLAAGDGPGVVEPPDLARRLSGAAIDVVIPAAWLMRRDLDAVAVASRPFLDAFVRHQIERITPWRVGDTHYRILERPLREDAGRLAIAVAVVPKRLVARSLSALEPFHPGALRLLSAEDAAGLWAISLHGGSVRRAAQARLGVVRGLCAAALAAVVLVGFLQWQASLARGDIDEQDRVLVERKAVLARTRRADDPHGEAAARLRVLRESRPTAAAVIDALSSALPDSAHLTALALEGDHVSVTGASTEPSALVPALETSGAFAEVAFGAATTRGDTGGGDRFSLEMKALPPRSDHAGPPSLETASSIARAAP